jgi:predicted nucleic acid-binding protein
VARLFIDSGVLIAAARGEAPLREAAVRLLTNPWHVFLTSPFVYLETVPKAQFGSRELELALYQLYLEHAQSLDDLPRLLQLALHISAQEG